MLFQKKKSLFSWETKEADVLSHSFRGSLTDEDSLPSLAVDGVDIHV